MTTVGPLGATSGDDRAARILQRVRAIPEGFVRTYGDIDPAAPRFVGHVLAACSEDVPWHRVVRADGTAALGAKQLARLRHEGVPIHGKRVDLAKARLPGPASAPVKGPRQEPDGHAER